MCASYTLRRDLTDALKVPGILGRSRPLRPEEALGRVRAPVATVPPVPQSLSLRQAHQVSD